MATVLSYDIARGVSHTEYRCDAPPRPSCGYLFWKILAENGSEEPAALAKVMHHYRKAEQLEVKQVIAVNKFNFCLLLVVLNSHSDFLAVERSH